jgi:folylpolyglutamate synthase/dihydropteroate synthase
MEQVATGADKVIFTKAKNSPRAADPGELAEIYTDLSDGRVGQVTHSLKQAMRIAQTAVTREDLICICGSFHLIGQAKELIEDIKKRR